MNGSNSNTSGGNVATIDFKRAEAGDKIPDDVISELARRLVATTENQEQGTIVLSPTPPGDTTKIWWQTDPLTSVPVGQPKLYDAASGQWVENSVAGATIPRTRHFQVFASAGNSQQNVAFQELATTDYVAILSPTTWVNGTWQTNPNANTQNWLITNKLSNGFTVAFYTVPTGGLTYDVLVMEKV